MKAKIMHYLPIEEEVIFFVVYGGTLSQSIITALSEGLENELKNKSFKYGKILTIFIELSQNILKSELKDNAILYVSKNENDDFFVCAINKVTSKEKELLETKLKKLLSLSKEEIKQEYKKLRKSGIDSHSKGAGIGFYEIARKSDEITFDFIPQEDNTYHYKIKVKVSVK